ncbi:winged helix-turn-helix domain-containing protein [Caulobacter endophyticus]|uniref:winged helix-turn-helix domain-containing protein n=1 Tax=Caulobacter endophyticus TaxID=2172652 RepID=UPI00241027F6|nr:transcriptional regulator [Caulobacter endophyticus]MDG2527900.1 transcriptional regulator [Caulobacter endophyticus]
MDAASTRAGLDRSDFSADREGAGTIGVVTAFGSEPLCFRDFSLLPAARILLRDGQAVEIGSRAFDLLHVLLRSRGKVVERAEIMRRVWPTTTVEESNLRVQVSALRKALGDDRELLKTVPGRGYLLAVDVASAGEPARGSTAETLRVLLDAALRELRELTRGGDACR